MSVGANELEPFHERCLAERAARLRLLLAILDFPIIWLDRTIPGSGTSGAYLESHAAAGALLIYAAVALIVLRRRLINLDKFAVLSSICDVLLITLLIVATDGYLSPFNLWFVVAVVGSSFSRYRFLPLLTAGMGLAAHSAIAAIPQEQPLDVSVFVVRTGYLFGVAALLSSMSTYLLRHSRDVALLEQAGGLLAETTCPADAAGLLASWGARLLAAPFAEVRLKDGTKATAGADPGGKSASWDIGLRQGSLGSLGVHGLSSVPENQRAMLRILCDRTAAALARMQMSTELAEAATAAERVRLADALHDAYLQTLAALDLKVHAAQRLLPQDGNGLQQELAAIRQMARDAAAQVRSAFRISGPPDQHGPAMLSELLARRWPGEHHAHIDPDANLSDGQWQAVEMLVKEGLNNAGRHGGASRISLRLGRSGDDRVVCELYNNGKSPQVPVQFGYGLMRLRCVIEEQHGRFRVECPETGGVGLIAEFEASYENGKCTDRG
jgi:signal transduction histidine kinase